MARHTLADIPKGTKTETGNIFVICNGAHVYGQDGTKRRDSCTIQLALFKPNIRTDRLVEQQVNAHPSLANSHSNCHFSAVLSPKTVHQINA